MIFLSTDMLFLEARNGHPSQAEVLSKITQPFATEWPSLH